MRRDGEMTAERPAFDQRDAGFAIKPVAAAISAKGEMKNSASGLPLQIDREFGAIGEPFEPLSAMRADWARDDGKISPINASNAAAPFTTSCNSARENATIFRHEQPWRSASSSQAPSRVSRSISCGALTIGVGQVSPRPA